MSFVLIEKPRPHVALVTLNRPERMNSMAFDVMIPLRDALEEVSLDNDTRVVVLTGAGHGFCSGADLEDSGTIPNIAGLTRSSIAQRSMELLHDVIVGLRRMHQPVIAAVNGAAIGGGFCLAVAADIRFAAEGAYFRAAGINNGLTSTELVGLVSRAVPGAQLLEQCYELAGRIIAFSRVGVESTKRMLWSSLDAGSLHAQMDAEAHAQLYVRLTTENFEEAVRARREKREPVFRD
jgi:enoyl-CoA hydratase